MPSENPITISWNWEDIQSIRPDYTQEQCEEMMDKVEKTLIDRSIEEGWDILEDLIAMRERD